MPSPCRSLSGRSPSGMGNFPSAGHCGFCSCWVGGSDGDDGRRNQVMKKAEISRTVRCGMPLRRMFRIKQWNRWAIATV